MKKIVINIPEVKWNIRTMFDKLVKSLTYEVDEAGEKLPKSKTKKPVEKQTTLQTQPKPTQKTAANENTPPLFPKTQKNSNTNKIQIQKEDLALISTALIRYKKHLAQNNQLEKAKKVGTLDQMFYEMMQPAKASSETVTQPPSNLSERYRQNKRERATNLG
ncbi:hypothetical protein [Microscilla marina]|uniref:Uncharacterized protein n=1 Tax=Microscilla marina ATCC 23134 TaxID=313606 RepID=A1ZKX5_MICM2|nr:hypothetical protein [Microscilla marina]EAY28941.1 hypothetical protein M23134_00095 [Microscilla marina ATCC 23134]